MSNIRLVPFEPNRESATFKDCVRLMKSNFNDHTATDPAFLDWLYLQNPYKKAIGYIAYDGLAPVSQLYMIFQKLKYGNEDRVVGILSNLCTEKEYRNRGLFSKLIGKLLIDAQKLDIPFVWAYPNPSSLHGFQKAGFKIVKNLSFELSPTSYTKFVKEFLSKEKISVLGETQEIDPPSSGFPSFRLISHLNNSVFYSQKFSTPLDNTQLSWRYLNHPTRKYYALEHRETGENIVIRLFKLFGFNAAAIMKQSTFENKKWNPIITSLRKDLNKSCSLILNISNTKYDLTDIFHNRYIIPKKLSPRTFPLAIYPIEDISMDPKDFIFSFGDYEAL